MNVRETLAFAGHGLMANKLRSALTTLGVLIGVGSVILLVAVGNGASQEVTDRIEALGTNRLTVTASSGGAGPFGFGPAGAQQGPTSSDDSLTLDDADALVDPTAAPDVAAASPVVSTTATATAGSDTTTAASSDISQVVGSDPDYFTTTNSTLSAGSTFNDFDVEHHRNVVVIGQSVVDDLFGARTDPVGESITIDGTPYEVVGVLGSKGSTGPQDSDSLAVMPVTTARDQLTGYGSVDQVVVRATSPDTTDAASAQVISILDQRHDVAFGESKFTVTDQASLLSTSEDTTETFTVLLGAVAAISLLVGGIGITNIMLVSVTERTREIGIRKAIGAPRRAIVGQFLAEAVALSVVGGALGVVLALIGSRFEIVGIQPVIVPASVVLAVVVSVLIGLFFGSFPANRAAGLRPIEALRRD